VRLLVRPILARPWADYLSAWTAALEAVPDRNARYALCNAQWKKRRNKTETMKRVRRRLDDMNGRLGTHCMYCEFNEANHLDHFEPRARAPGRTFDWSNLFLACDTCDSRKQARYEEDGTGLVPACPTDAASPPEAHLRFLSTGGVQHLSETGRWTCDVFDLRRPTLVAQRRDRWAILRAFIIQWDVALGQGDAEAASRHRDLVRRPPFLSVLRDLLASARSPDAELLDLGPIADIARRRPEILSWHENDPPA
jgi:uncharacterized protein (TIGR02646 family)